MLSKTKSKDPRKEIFCSLASKKGVTSEGIVVLRCRGL